MTPTAENGLKFYVVVREEPARHASYSSNTRYTSYKEAKNAASAMAIKERSAFYILEAIALAAPKDTPVEVKML